uniref:V-SNARE coiled-coil homology domain-containing protein n=1 Tax=Amphiprion ocellaris TaxID=80972 RepID=A0A3Q1C767_AMPOC
KNIYKNNQPKSKADGCFRPQVVDIMRVNVDNVLERDQKLSELDDRADALQAGASQFESSKNCKLSSSRSVVKIIIQRFILFFNDSFLFRSCSLETKRTQSELY